MATGQVRFAMCSAVLAKELSTACWSASLWPLAAVVRAWTLGGPAGDPTVALTVAAIVVCRRWWLPSFRRC